MSHFVVLCILNSSNSKIALNPEFRSMQERESIVEKMLAPYSEHIEVPEYSVPCWSCSHAKQTQLRTERVKAQLGVGSEDEFLDKIRAQHQQWLTENNVEPHSILRRSPRSQKNWDKLLAPLRAIDDAVKAEMRDADPKSYGRAECETCKGSGSDLSRYNPMSKWDWYQIGGRWTGMISPADYDPTDDPKNTVPCFACGANKGRVHVLHAAKMLTAPSFFGDDDPNDERTQIRDSHRVAIAADPSNAVAAIAELAPDRFKSYDESTETVACHCCNGTGYRSAWPTSYVPHDGDIQPLSIYKSLLAKGRLAKEKALQDDPECDARNEYIPYSLCVECDEDSSTPSKWHSRGQMRMFGMADNEISPEGWESDVTDLIASLPDDLAIVVVDCHI